MQIDLVEFYPFLAALVVTGFIVGLVFTASREFIPRISFFAEESLPVLDYGRLANVMSRSGLLMSLVLGLFAYPLYSSDLLQRDAVVQIGLCVAIASPIAELCEALFQKFS